MQEPLTKFTPEMSIMDAIYQRRAVRSYQDQIVSYETIHALLEAAVHAPTAIHREPWAFAVIEKEETLERLSDCAKGFINELDHDVHTLAEAVPHLTRLGSIFYNAPALIIIYGKPMGPFVTADCWLAAENLMLAACSMGLGTCVIGLAAPALNTPEWKKELEIPDGMTAIAPIIVGVPSGKLPPTSRKEPQILAWK